MGFKLGSALGKVASAAVRQVTGNRIRPTFSKPAARVVTGSGTGAGFGFASQRPDSTVTQINRGSGFLPSYSSRTTSYYSDGDQLGQIAAGQARMIHCKLNKSTYVTRGGGTSRWPQQLIVHPAKTECVPRRHINAGNGRAATRAVRRLVAFYRLSQRVAKQLRRAASAAHIRGARHVGGAARGQRLLPRGNVTVVE